MPFLPADCHGNLTVLNLLSASVTKNQHFRPCRKNYALDRKMIATFRNCHDVLYRHAKFGADRTTRAGCRSENWCFCMSRLVCLRVGDIVQTNIVWGFMGQSWCGLQHFFSQWIFLSGALYSSHFCCQVALQFSRNWGQKLRKVQKLADTFVRTTSYR